VATDLPDHHAVHPPSTGMFAPVMSLEAYGIPNWAVPTIICACSLLHGGTLAGIQ